MFIDNLERKLNETGKDEFSVSEIEEQINQSLNIFDIKIIQNDINGCHIAKLQVETDIEALEKVKAKLDKKAKFRTNALYSFLYTLLLAEFGGFYYAIYMVPWLGWDLMEPVTFTVGQTYFMCACYFYMKNSEDSNYKNLADFLNNHFRNKIYKKNGFEI